MKSISFERQGEEDEEPGMSPVGVEARLDSGEDHGPQQRCEQRNDVAGDISCELKAAS